MSTKIVVFANIGYLNVLDNWLAAVRRHPIDGITIIALDEQIHADLKGRCIPSLLRPCNPRLESLWIHRIAVIRELMAAGHDIIHSDADAVWLRNPLPYLDALDHHMIFSQGTIWPPDILAHFGFVLCCGFFMLRNNPMTMRFLEQLEERVKHDKDDQVSCNRLLMEREVRWSAPTSGYLLPFRGHEFICDTAVRTGSSGSLRVGLLPHAAFQRIYEDHDSVYVRHLVSEKNNEDTMKILSQYDCLFV